MPTYSYTTNVVVTAASTNAVNLVAYDYAYVAQNVTVSSSGANGSAINGVEFHQIVVAGDVFGSNMGIRLTGTGGQNIILVNSTGSVTGLVFGIYGDGAGNVLTNAGTVAGYNGVGFVAGNATILNSGHIQGVIGIFFSGDGTAANKLVNSGDILSPYYAIVAGDSADSVINKGLVVGIVSLGGGNDLLDSRGGVLEGKVVLGDGNDTAYGGEGADDIQGGNDKDLIRGKQGDDRLDGGNGKDKLIGGLGEDEFVFRSALGPTNFDTVGDFTHGEDTIVLSSTIFAALGPSVGKAEFVAKASGHAATNASQHIIYDKAKGTLWYDADGNGSGAAVKFAQLGTTTDHPTNLTHLDFAIV